MGSTDLIDALLASANEPASDHLQAYRLATKIIESGVEARIRALQSVYLIRDIPTQFGIACTLIAHEPGMHEGIYEQALKTLSASDKQSDLALLAETAYIFDGHVSRHSMRTALNVALAGATGTLAADLREGLHRYGRIRVGDGWRWRLGWAWCVAGISGFVGWWVLGDRGTMSQTLDQARESGVTTDQVVADVVGSVGVFLIILIAVFVLVYTALGRRL